jgi:hypothetical protein
MPATQIGLWVVGYLTPNKSAPIMPKPTSARHIHNTLSYLSPEKHALHKHGLAFSRLPFIHCNKAGAVYSFWALPAKGGYFGGYTTGKAMAHAYIKLLSTAQGDRDAYILASIIAGLAKRISEIKESDPDDESIEASSLRGQNAGFINTLGETLLTASKLLSGVFSSISEADVIQLATHGLKQCDKDVYALAERLDREAEAKECRQ